MRRLLWHHWMMMFIVAMTGQTKAAILTFSSGLAVPETISQAPANFGSFGGSYFVPDAGTDDIRIVPSSGGTSTLFRSLDFDVRGGLFLPDGSSYVAVGEGNIVRLNAGGSITGRNSVSGGLTDVVMAPAGFGSLAGMLLISDQSGGIVAADPSSLVTRTFVDGFSLPVVRPFGLAFAPGGFGSVGGKLLVSETFGGAPTIFGGHIIAVDSAGRSTPFATIPLGFGQLGLRQMAFSPPSFGSLGNRLFVSVSGSLTGGGTVGAVYVLDESGNIDRLLRLGNEFRKFDPRGMFFVGDKILISDASDPILIASASDFDPVAVPEPSSMVLWTTAALVGLGYVWLRHRTAPDPPAIRSPTQPSLSPAS
jgi:hypothetical protein